MMRPSSDVWLPRSSHLHPPTCTRRPRPHRCSTLAAEFNGEVAIGVPQPKAAPAEAAEGAIGVNNNNYVRDQGQNVG